MEQARSYTNPPKYFIPYYSLSELTLIEKFSTATNKIVGRGVLIYYPKFSERFIIHADAGKIQLRQVIRGKREFRCLLITQGNPCY